MATIYTPWAALVNAAFIVCFIVFTLRERSQFEFQFTINMANKFYAVYFIKNISTQQKLIS